MSVPFGSGDLSSVRVAVAPERRLRGVRAGAVISDREQQQLFAVERFTNGLELGVLRVFLRPHLQQRAYLPAPPPTQEVSDPALIRHVRRVNVM
jgi:hypothetical protein